jgi:hypothetical protein
MTTALVVDSPTPLAPPEVVNPQAQLICVGMWVEGGDGGGEGRVVGVGAQKGPARVTKQQQQQRQKEGTHNTTCVADAGRLYLQHQGPHAATDTCYQSSPSSAHTDPPPFPQPSHPDPCC